MTQKERFVQLVHMALCAIAPHRVSTAGMRSALRLSVDILAHAQNVQEECIPQEDIEGAVEEFILHYDPDYAYACTHETRVPPRREWLKMYA